MTGTPAVETVSLAKRYRRTWALRDCTLTIPAGRIAALVGPNGSGKTTLLRMLVGLTPPTSGALRILGADAAGPGHGHELLGLVGYLDQSRPLYRGFRVGDMLRFGRLTNPSWDDERARRWIGDLGIPLGARVGALSGGQHAQVALALALAKRPSVLLLDEPVASLDPIAREDLMHVLLQAVVDDGLTVVISSHVVSELAAVCDYVVVLADGVVQLAGDVDAVLARHRLVVGSRGTVDRLSGADARVIMSATAGRQVTSLVRCPPGHLPETAAEVIEPTLENVVMAYLRQGRRTAPKAPVAATAGGVRT